MSKVARQWLQVVFAGALALAVTVFAAPASATSQTAQKAKVVTAKAAAQAPVTNGPFVPTKVFSMDI